MEPPLPRSYVSLRQVNWRVVIGLIGLNTIFLFLYRQLDYVANAYHRSPLLTFSEEAAGGLAGLAVFPLVYQMAVRFPLLCQKWRLHLLAHLVGVCLISIVHTTLIALFRFIAFPVLGFGSESYGYLPARYPMEFAHLFIYYWITLSLIYFFHEIRFAQERELQQAKLESNLAEAQLQNLRLQLEPHFLGNALNAISAALYEDPRVADEMIGRLGELLRQLLKDDRSQLVPIAREIELLQLYTRIMEARLEDRLQVTIKIDPSTCEALVPQMILQPLVENAIRHGMNADFKVRVVISAQLERSTLRLQVRDHGPGIDESRPLLKNIGLRNTTARLQQIYGRDHTFTIHNAVDGGAIVNIDLPFQTREPLLSPPVNAAHGVL